MTLSVLSVGPQFPNMQYFDVCYVKVYEGIESYLEVSPLSANIGNIVSFYALLWKLIWKRWALRVLYFINHMYGVFTLYSLGLPRVAFESNCSTQSCACFVLL